MSNVIGLVAKPTAEDEVRESVVRMLRKALEEAEAGKIDSLVMIVGCPNGEWCDRASETVKFSEAIGRLEITKQEWIARFRERD